MEQIRIYLGLLQELFSVRRDNVDIGGICEGSERERAKKLAHVGRIMKIVHCVRIVFGLPYNCKPKSHSNRAVRLARGVLRDSFAIQIESHVAEPDAFAYRTLYRRTVNKTTPSNPR